MSYILDALKKSERQRRLGHDPFFKQVMPGVSTGRRQVFVALGAALLLVAASAAVWIFWQEPPMAIEAPVEAPAPPPPAVVETPRQENATAASAVTEPVEPSSTAPSADLVKPAQANAGLESSLPKPAVSARARAVPAAAAGGDAPWLSSLPEAFRNSLPPLAVNIHVYAVDEAQRILYINNHPYHRGEQVQDGIVVEDVVEDGVVLKYHGQRFKLPRPR
jgi:general secretion pathway protein B